MALRENVILKTIRGRWGGVAVLAVALAAAGAAMTSRGCDERASADVGSVRLGGKWFHLELALDNDTRFKGLSGRSHIEPDGGMLFVFKYPQPLEFLMRDCPVPIDIAFLDGSGRIVSMHEMTPEPPRADDEKELNPVTGVNAKYEARLKRYPSRFDAQFVIEVAGGTLKRLGVKPGDVVELDAPGLKRQAR